jgi:hypothetical protein
VFSWAIFLIFVLLWLFIRLMFCIQHGGGVRCKLAGCNRVAIGKLQLCRAHGGGARPKHQSSTSSSAAPPQQQFVPPASQFQQMPSNGMSTFGQTPVNGSNGGISHIWVGGDLFCKWEGLYRNFH